MGYSFHIERLVGNDRVDISLEEWHEAVAKVEGVRQCIADVSIANPARPDQIVRMPVNAGSLDVYLPAKETWVPAINWRGGRGSFRAPDQLDSSSPVWVAATKLANLLDAKIRGDEGECYDLESGAIVLSD
jgi:hypothetical protein